VRDGVRLAMLARATAPFWMEFQGVGCRVRGRVGDGLGMRRRCRQRRRRVARWSAVETGGSGSCGGVKERKAAWCSACERLREGQEVADLGAVWRGAFGRARRFTLIRE
jgi:hypothetical protein